MEAWKAIVGKDRSTEKPRIQTFLTQLAGLKMAPGEKVTDYLTQGSGNTAGPSRSRRSDFQCDVHRNCVEAPISNFWEHRHGSQLRTTKRLRVEEAGPHQRCQHQGRAWHWRGFNCLPLKRGQQQEEDHVLQVPKGGAHGAGLQVKGKQPVLPPVQHKGPSCKGLQEQEVAVQWHQPGSRKARLLQLRELWRGFRGGRTRAVGGLWMQRVDAEGQGSLQGPRRGIQTRCGQCQLESNTSGM